MATAASPINFANVTQTGTLANLPQPSFGLSGSGTFTISMAGSAYQTLDLIGNLSMLTVKDLSIKNEGRSVSVRVSGGSSSRTLTWDSRMRFLGTKPTSLQANKWAGLSLVSFGTTVANTMASYAAEV